MKREIIIRVETERTIEIGEGRDSEENWCASCGAYTPMLTVEMAAALACLGTGAIHHWIEAAAFHSQPARTGLPRICQRSFIDHLKRLNFLPKPKRLPRPAQE